MASSSAGSPVPLRVAPPNCHPYPPPLATYEDVVASHALFMDTLQELHAFMRTKFMTPTIGGKVLDLHRLFVEVTGRGGIAKVLGEKRWKEVTAVFNFPSSATNASFILRKYYVSLLHHYERVYYFKAKYWTPSPPDVLQQVSHSAAPPPGLAGYVLPSPETGPAMPPPQSVNTAVPQSVNTAVPEATTTPTGSATTTTTGSSVLGVIDGKFESGYLITVKIGSEDFKGVLYQVPTNTNNQVRQHQNLPVHNTGSASSTPGVVRRKRRKKCEIKKRDPSHPKPNRSGYNFFFAEQHARLKPLYPGKDREISRMIGELWNQLQGPEKMVYQDKAIQDKERYRLEMEDYREGLKRGQIFSNVEPTQLLLGHNVETTENGSSHRNVENRPNADKFVETNSENNKGTDQALGVMAPPVLQSKANNVTVEALGDEEEFDLMKRVDMGEYDEQMDLHEEEEDDEAYEEDDEDEEELPHSQEKVLFFLDDKTLLPPPTEGSEVPPIRAGETKADMKI